MTKPDVLAPGAGRKDVADLDLVARHDDPVDEQLDQLPPLLERGAPQAGRDSGTERLQRGREPMQLVEPRRLPGEPPLLLGERRVAGPDLGPTALVLRQRDDAAQVGL